MIVDSQFLNNISLFTKISSASLNDIEKSIDKSFYKRGTIILNPSSVKNTLLFVVRGWVKLFTGTAEGEEVIVDVLNENHFWGEEFIFEKDENNNYSAQAITDVEIFTLPIQLLKRLIKIDHQLSLNFLEYIIQKQKNLNMEVEHLSIQNALQRVGCFILRLCRMKQGKNITLRLPYDKNLLATRLGIRPETFSRILKKLGKECNIKIEDDTLHIKDIDKLVHFVCQQCSKTFPCKDVKV